MHRNHVTVKSKLIEVFYNYYSETKVAKILPTRHWLPTQTMFFSSSNLGFKIYLFCVVIFINKSNCN